MPPPEKGKQDEEPMEDLPDFEEGETKISDEQAANELKRLLPAAAKDENLLAYLASVSAELANSGANTVEEWTAALAPALTHVVDMAALTTACTQLKKILVLVSDTEDVRNDPTCLAHVDPLTLGYMGKILLLRARMHLTRGHRYGLVGENGAGKTTLMRKLAACELPGFDKMKTMYVEPDFDEADEHHKPAEYLKLTQMKERKTTDQEEIDRVLNELAFTEKLKDTPISELSGGWRMRVSLARATMVKADLLLLDEPTNHLDTSAVEWLMGFLQSVKMTAIIISHEPFFLDAVTTDIIMINKHSKKLQFFEGNFSSFTKKQKVFTSADLETSIAQGPGDALNFRFPDPGKPIGVTSMTRAIVTLKGVNFAYNQKKGNILWDITCRLSLSSRVAVVGPNGAGKSTLIKLMVGEITESSGSCWKHHNLVVAYVAQHSFAHLEKVKNKNVLHYIKQRFGRGYDNESAAYKETNEDEVYVVDSDFRSGQVEEILGRRKFKNAMAYEVKWVGKEEANNTWEDAGTLRKLGAGRMVEQCDEKIKAKKSGLDKRPLTNMEVTRHVMDFGLDKQYAMARIEGLSGGQRCKLVLAGALWLRPHLLVLDEPTNYLDLEALGALARAIHKFKGGMIMVSHNKEFMSEICNEKWTVDAGRLKQEMGPMSADEHTAKERKEGPGVRREVGRRHSTMRQSGTEEGVLEDLLSDALDSSKELDRLKAAETLLDLLNNDKEKSPELVHGLMDACLNRGLLKADGAIFEKVFETCKRLVAKYGQRDLEKLLPLAESAVAKAHVEVKAVVAAPVNVSIGGPKFAVGQAVMGLWTDKKFYKGTVQKITSTSPVKYSIHYTAMDKVATVPEKGGVKKMKKSKEVEVKSDANDPARHFGSALAVWTFLAQLQGADKAAATVDYLVDIWTTKGLINMKKVTQAVGRMLSKASADLSDADREARVASCWALALKDGDSNLQAGAAECVAALVGGSKGSLLPFVTKLDALVDDKDTKKAGLLLYGRCFSQMGGRFEYHIASFLPKLMKALADKSSSVSRAAEVCTMVVMSSLSLHGGKLMLPGLLEGLSQKSWKLKVDNIKVLGNMAYCTPELMASSLPVVVPRLLDALAEPKKEVSEAAIKAVEQISSVIENPEIKPLVPLLHSALKDSFNNTKLALDSLAKTSFAHAIDPASLALIMPITIKGIKDRKPETKKTALKVVAALAALVLDIRDILPYLMQLRKYLRAMIFHNLPELREEAAKALGALVNEIGHEARYFPGLNEWITSTMQAKETTPTQMSGAALALAYIMHGKELDVTTKALPGIMEMTKHSLGAARSGHLDLLVILNNVYGEVFQEQYLEEVLPVCLYGMADKVMPVSEAAFEASQEFVSKSVGTQLHQVLPLLVEGLRHKDYKVRTNFLQLVGTTLLNLVTTTNFGMSVRFYGDGNSIREGELANQASKEQEETIEAALGLEQRNSLFASLYVMRFDAVETVGAMAWRVWHLVVPSEKDMLLCVLPMVMTVSIAYLTSEDKTVKDNGRKAVGGMVKVTGDEGLSRMIPILSEKLGDEDDDKRKAGCLGFSELLREADKSLIGAYLSVIIPLIRDMLCDSVFQVRVGAGHAFRQLYKNVGNKAIEKIAPYLIDSMKDEKANNSNVDGLKLVLEGCARNTFFYLCASALSTLKEQNNNVNQKLRVAIVEMLVPLIDSSTDVAVINACQTLHRFVEEMPEYALKYVGKIAAPMIRKIGSNPYLREGMRQAIYQCLYQCFQFGKGVAAGKTAMAAFIREPPSGYKVKLVGGSVGMLQDDLAAELVTAVSVLVPETQVLVLTEMKLMEDAPEEEVPAAGADGDAPEDGPPPGVKATEKWCPKCKQVKAKTKYSKKMVKMPKGLCKVCS